MYGTTGIQSGGGRFGADPGEGDGLISLPWSSLLPTSELKDCTGGGVAAAAVAHSPSHSLSLRILPASLAQSSLQTFHREPTEPN